MTPSIRNVTQMSIPAKLSRIKCSLNNGFTCKLRTFSPGDCLVISLWSTTIPVDTYRYFYVQMTSLMFSDIQIMFHILVMLDLLLVSTSILHE